MFRLFGYNKVKVTLKKFISLECSWKITNYGLEELQIIWLFDLLLLNFLSVCVCIMLLWGEGGCCWGMFYCGSNYVIKNIWLWLIFQLSSSFILSREGKYYSYIANYLWIKFKGGAFFYVSVNSRAHFLDRMTLVKIGEKSSWSGDNFVYWRSKVTWSGHINKKLLLLLFHDWANIFNSMFIRRQSKIC